MYDVLIRRENLDTDRQKVKSMWDTRRKWPYLGQGELPQEKKPTLSALI